MKRFCTFRVDALTFGVDVVRVREILPARLPTPVPLADPWILGLMNLRGEITTVVDLRTVLEFGSGGRGAYAWDVVVASAIGVMALRVDEVGDVVGLSERQAELPPVGLPRRIIDLVPRVYQMNECVLHEVDIVQVQVAIGAVAPGQSPEVMAKGVKT